MGTRVYIGRLPSDVRERDLEKFFKGYGRIREILLKNGFGFVEFDDYKDADDAVYELDGKELLGERIIVARARGTARRGNGVSAVRRRSRSNWTENYANSDHGSKSRHGPPTRTEYRLIVENLSSRVSWQDLKDYMRQAGEVTYADAHKTHRNEGVVEFATYTDMKNAIEKLSDTELSGRRIKLIEDKSNKSSSRRRSRSHSRSSRSRSRSRSPRSHSRSRSRSRSRSPRSKSRSKSKSKSTSRSRSPHSRTLSKSKYKSKSKSKSRSRSGSRNRSKSRSASRCKSLEKRKSISRSPDKSSKSEQRTPDKDTKDE